MSAGRYAGNVSDSATRPSSGSGAALSRTATIPWGTFSAKHRAYIRAALKNRMCVAEGAIRSGKTIDHCIIAAAFLEDAPDRFHLASGSTIANAKLNIIEDMTKKLDNYDLKKFLNVLFDREDLQD